MSSFQHELELDAAQKRRAKSIQRRIKKALMDLRALAEEIGVEEPSYYYECGGTLCVFDEARGDAASGSITERQDKVALAISLYDGWGDRSKQVYMDCGAW